MYIVYDRNSDQEIQCFKSLIAAQKKAEKLNDKEEMYLFDVRLDDATMRAAYANV